MLYQIGLFFLLISCFAFWVGCGQTAINDSEVNSAVTTSDQENTNNNTTDNDTTEFTISAISGNTTEAGDTATFTVKLSIQPSSDVIIAISSNDTGEGTVSPSSLTFTSVNWEKIRPLQ